MATFAEDGAITLYHNNVAILATAATGISVAGDVTATDDLNLTSDAAVLSFGENSEVTLTHVHNDGLLLNADNQLQFRDNAINIRSPADGDLDINADDEIELNSTLIDINGNVEISGTLAQVGVATFTARDIHSGGITIANDGTIGSVGDADAITISSAGVVTFSQTPVFSGDSTFSDDISLTSDGAIINFGENSEVTLTHVHDDGLLLNSDNQLQFRDAAIHISSTADGDLSIAADDEIDITSTLIDINGNVDISGTTLMTGVATHGGNVISDTDSTDDLGTTGVRWANLFVDAITATDQITATGFTGTLDGILGSGAAAAATTTTLASTTITASGIIKTDDTTAATSTTDGSLQTDGGLSVAGAAIIGGSIIAGAINGADISILSTVTSDNGDLGEINFHNTTNAGSGSGTSFVHQVAAIQGKMEGTGNNSGGSLHFITKADGGTRTEVMSLDAGGDLALLTDASVLSFGADSEITLTHVHNTGLLLGTDTQLQFRDSAINIRSDADGDLMIAADDEIDLTSTLIDINGNLDVSGTYTGAGVMTTGGNVIIPDAGTIGSANDHDAIAIGSDGDVTLTQDLELQHDGAILSFGANDEVTLTHVHNTGLELKAEIDEDSAYNGQLNINSVTKSSGNLARILFTHGDHGSASIASDYESAGNGNLIFSTRGGGDPTERMRITGAGRLGIGTAAPGVPLQVKSAGGVSHNGYTQLSVENTDHTVLAMRSPNDKLCQIIFDDVDAVGRGQITYNHNEDSMSFASAAAERMRINNAGDVLVGKTATSYTTIGVRLGQVGISNFCHNTSGSTNIQMAAPVSTGQMAFYRQDTGALMGTINNGSSNSVVYATTSDYRLKENVEYDWDATTRLKQLKPAQFNFLSDPDTTIDGFLAHEAQEVVPESVTGVKDEVDDEDKPVMQGIDQAKLVPILVKSLQEAVDKIDTLTTRIEALEA